MQANCFFELHSERVPRPPPADCGVSERIKKQTEFLTVGDSLQPACWSVAEIPFSGAAGNLQ